ncbi:MAG TPA: N-(5'-phosphoribosyl)anthranilate isomerase, partial [Candidatus Marinimicrobia bacterium]|nr:N-(5'-phosphoribosyl)anthranilate isomerase [Candidatus Neomarinimicrobiota bacterium]
MIPVKICGITSLADAELAVEHGTSAIGFIFYEKSPRAPTIQVAKSISERLSASISK